MPIGVPTGWSREKTWLWKAKSRSGMVVSKTRSRGFESSLPRVEPNFGIWFFGVSKTSSRWSLCAIHFRFVKRFQRSRRPEISGSLSRSGELFLLRGKLFLLRGKVPVTGYRSGLGFESLRQCLAATRERPGVIRIDKTFP